MKFKKYINEGPKISKKKSMKIQPGKKQYFISATHLKTGKQVNGYIQTNSINNIHKSFGEYGWIINRYYET